MTDPSFLTYSSVQLIGDLLFRISGISGKISEEEEGEEDAPEDAAPGMDAAKKALIDGLGKERRDRVLAAIYIVRQDAVGAVRQGAIGVWKALVSNTPRTAREILPVLSTFLLLLLFVLSLTFILSQCKSSFVSSPVPESTSARYVSLLSSVPPLVLTPFFLVDRRPLLGRHLPSSR